MSKAMQCLKTLSICLVMLLSACQPKPLHDWKKDKLIIIVSNSSNRPNQLFERDLAQLFAKQLDAKIEFLAVDQDKIYTALQRRQGHFAAAALRSNHKYNSIRFSSSYQEVGELVICRDEVKPIKYLAGLPSVKIDVVAGSSGDFTLKEAQKRLPSIHLNARNKTNIQTILSEVANGATQCAVANELQLAEARNHHPKLTPIFELKPSSKLAWAFPIDGDPVLYQASLEFFERIEQDGTLRRLYDRYYGFSQRLDLSDSQAFINRIRTTLPSYRSIFKEASSITNLDWRLLAALAYQESQWDPMATSFANVRGMMMLTEDTAERMDVSNRLDARESIMAGAKYLSLLKKQLPAHVPEPDRTWLAIAAYNQGYGHLEDARILTKRAGLSPDSWADIKKWMPQLSKAEFADTVKHGYARGGEAVIMVENIRSFYSILQRLEPDNNRPDNNLSNLRGKNKPRLHKR